MFNTFKIFENNYMSYIQKKVILKENMALEINILNQAIINISSNVQIYSFIRNVLQLEQTLFFMDKLNICLGAPYHNMAYKDISGVWKHKKCTIIISEISGFIKMCKFCVNKKTLLQQKYCRKEKTNTIKRIRLSVMTINNYSITTQKKKNYCSCEKHIIHQKKRKKRNKYIAKKLKKDLMNNMHKVNEICKTTIETQLKSKNIFNNCKAVRIDTRSIRVNNAPTRGRPVKNNAPIEGMGAKTGRSTSEFRESSQYYSEVSVTWKPNKESRRAI
ncbi:hypothetical protein PUN28_020618 [Cardiocondyla obscurior]|uniref:Uncharacterized protein n=1 Tax=Cardiocondyla obscurior TaxID=286306 RepID=A0AAW2EA52_9HYME